MWTAKAPRVAVLGLGLIGGSLFQLLHRRGHPVTGYDNNPAIGQLVRQQTAGGHANVVDSIAQALETADLTVMAVPLRAIDQLIDELGRVGYSGLITDVTSVKTTIAAAIRERLPQARWVGGHPMAGSEDSGFTASSPTLLQGCAWVLCLDDDTNLDDWLRLARWVADLGCRVVPTSSGDHDDAVARISHIPHAIASALTSATADAPQGRAALGIAAGSFRDATRVAATAPEAVTAWFAANAAAIASGLTPIIDRLTRLRDALQTNGQLPPEAHRWLQQAHDIRRAWPLEGGTLVSLPPTAKAIVDLGRAGGWIINVESHQLEAMLPKAWE